MGGHHSSSADSSSKINTKHMKTHKKSVKRAKGAPITTTTNTPNATITTTTSTYGTVTDNDLNSNLGANEQITINSMNDEDSNSSTQTSTNATVTSTTTNTANTNNANTNTANTNAVANTATASNAANTNTAATSTTTTSITANINGGSVTTSTTVTPPPPPPAPLGTIPQYPCTSDYTYIGTTYTCSGGVTLPAAGSNCPNPSIPCCPDNGALVNGACYPSTNMHGTTSGWPTYSSMQQTCTQSYNYKGPYGKVSVVCTPDGLTVPSTQYWPNPKCMENWTLNSSGACIPGSGYSDQCMPNFTLNSSGSCVPST